MSNVSIQVLEEFFNIFKGNENGHGVHIYDKNFIQYSGEKEGEALAKKGIVHSWTEKDHPVTEELYRDHLEGKRGLGISPVNNNNKCHYAVIDVDIYEKLKISTYIDLIYETALPLMPFRTKSGGLHLYLFFKDKIPAKEAISLCRTIKYLLGIAKDTEVFPKQEKLEENHIGSWTNLPYYDYENPRTGLINAEHKLVPLQEALTLIEQNRINIKDLDIILNQLPLSDAPPCLQIIYMSRETKFRNLYLFSLARYYKTKNGDDFERKIQEANERLFRPLTPKELDSQVIASHKKKDWSYKCKDEPLHSLCNKEYCKQREYGIGGEVVSDLSFEGLLQIQSDPPKYEWTINGTILQFFSEAEIIKQEKFRELCFRKLKKLPYRLKDANWNKIINSALENMQLKPVQEGDDISSGTFLKEYLTEFFERRTPASNREQILNDRVYKDLELEAYIFKPKNLWHFLISQKSFKDYPPRELESKLKEMRAGPIRYNISTTMGTTRAWMFPFKDLENYKDGDDSKVIKDDKIVVDPFKITVNLDDVDDKIKIEGEF